MTKDISKKSTENGESDEKPFFHTKLSFYKNLSMNGEILILSLKTDDSRVRLFLAKSFQNDKAAILVFISLLILNISNTELKIVYKTQSCIYKHIN